MTVLDLIIALAKFDLSAEVYMLSRNQWRYVRAESVASEKFRPDDVCAVPVIYDEEETR